MFTKQKYYKIVINYCEINRFFAVAAERQLYESHLYDRHWYTIIGGSPSHSPIRAILIKFGYKTLQIYDFHSLTTLSLDQLYKFIHLYGLKFPTLYLSVKIPKISMVKPFLREELIDPID